MSNINKYWKKTVIKDSSTIQDAIFNLNLTGLRIVLVEDELKKFAGVVMDGDIRRGLLKGIKLESSIKSILKKNAIIVNEYDNKKTIIEKMQINNISQIPVIDANNRIVNLYFKDNLKINEKYNNSFVIMAGGKGSRLLPHTYNKPKPLVEVAGKPIIMHIIEKAKENGFYNFIISINHMGEQIKDYLGDGKSLGVDISYIKESMPLGTAGSLSLLDNKVISPVIIVNGDVLCDVNFKNLLDFHMEHSAEATMAVQIYKTDNPYAIIDVEGINIKSIKEKPIYQNYINAGIYVINNNNFSYLTYETHCDMPDFFQLLIKKNKSVIACPVHEKWHDIGTSKDIMKANLLQD